MSWVEIQWYKTMQLYFTVKKSIRRSSSFKLENKWAKVESSTLLRGCTRRKALLVRVRARCDHALENVTNAW